MKHTTCILTLLFWLTACQTSLFSQPAEKGGAKIYKGYRVSLYGFKVLDMSEKNLTIRYHVANTGRESVSFGKGKLPPETLIVELDTMNLPKSLAGKENHVTEAFLKEKISLSPGQLQQNLNLKVPLATAAKPLETPKPALEQPVPKEEKVPEPQSEVLPQGRCADLIFDTVFVIKRSDKSATLQFVIKNVGDATARLLGASDEKEDNLAVNVYFVSGVKLTRGSFLADGMYFRDKETQNGLLLPGQRLRGEIEISLKSRTKFQPNLVFELDPFQTLTECDKTNNTRPLKLE